MTNLTKKADREADRAECLAELKAVEENRWPRDTNDLLRWSRGTAEYAAQMCKSHLEYLDDLERRLASGDPSLEGWER